MPRAIGWPRTGRATTRQCNLFEAQLKSRNTLARFAVLSDSESYGAAMAHGTLVEQKIIKPLVSIFCFNVSSLSHCHWHHTDHAET